MAQLRGVEEVNWPMLLRATSKMNLIKVLKGIQNNLLCKVETVMCFNWQHCHWPSERSGTVPSN